MSMVRMNHKAMIWVSAERLDQLDEEAHETAARAFTEDAQVQFEVTPVGEAGVYEQSLSGPPSWQQDYLVTWGYIED